MKTKQILKCLDINNGDANELRRLSNVGVSIKQFY